MQKRQSTWRRDSDRFKQHPSSLGRLEQLEPRMLLYSPAGGTWAHPELVTVSFMPDGTDVGGTPSNLQSTLNARWSPAIWQQEMFRGIQNWAAVANMNFSVVADDGSPFGSAGATGSDNNVQGDSNFGDIRIGGFDLGSSLGIGMLPPPINQDTTAGDFFLNTTSSWNIGSSYDLLTVSTHEAGHVIGLDHSAESSAEMYAYYNGVKTNLTLDDIAGIQSLYGARPHDAFDVAASNDSRFNASIITSYIDRNKQVSLSNLDITTGSDVDYYKITIPKGTAGSITIKMQTAGLSLLAPKLSLYKKNGSLVSSVTGSFNSTVEITRSISKDKNYYIAADGADSSVFGVGSYALQVNMGTAAQAPVASPNTDTAASGSGENSAGQSSGSGSLVGSQLGTASAMISSGLQLLTDLMTQGKALADSFGNDAGSTVVAAPHSLGSPNLGSHQSGHSHMGHESMSKVLDHVADSDPLDVRRPGFALIRELIKL